MKTKLRLALALATFALATTASAQQRAADRPTIGLGVSFSPVDVPDPVAPTVELYVPIAVAPTFRLEPSLGIFTFDTDGGGSTSAITFGIGAFFVKRLAAPADMYAGGRLKLNFASDDTGPEDLSGTDVVVAAALGGEYYLVPQLSLGLEAQLGLFDLGEASGDGSGFFTNGLAFLRFYF